MNEKIGKQEWSLLILSAVLISLSYPPLPLGFLAHFALVPLFFLIENKSLKMSFKLGFLWGLLSSLLLLHWLTYVTLIGTILACLVLALYPAFIIWFYNLVSVKLSRVLSYFLFPFFWVGMEYIRGTGELGFPWADLAHTQIKYPVFVQFADITGSRGISFWVVVLNLLVYGIIKNIKRKNIFIFLSGLLLVYAIPCAYGIKALKRKWIPKEDFRLALLQGNVDPHKKWDDQFRLYHFQEYLKMVKEVGTDVSLVVWPETATANYFRREQEFTTKLKGIIESTGIPNLVGALDYEYINGKLHEYNSAVLIYPNGEWVWYAKMHLVPFSEHLPFDQYIPVFRELNRKVNFGQGDFSPGKTKTIMRINGIKFGTLICFESIFSELARDFIKAGAEFLIVITNDGWFGGSAGPYQHMEIARLRAIENRIFIARCANTGISCFIDPAGHIISKIPLNVKGYLIGSVGLKEKTTFFTRYGDIISRLSFAFIPATFIGIILKNLLA